MKMKAKVGNVITVTSMVVAVIALTISAVLFVLSANQQRTNATLTVSYVATNVYVEVDAKYQKKLDASPTALTGGPLTFQPTGVSSTGTLSAGDIVLSPNDNYVLFTYSFKNKATVGGYDIAVTLTDTVNKVNTKVYYAYNDTSTAMSTMATNMTNSKTTTAPQNITIPAQQTKYIYIYVEIDDWYLGASYTSDASHFLKFDIASTMIDFENNYQIVDYIESSGTEYIDTGVAVSRTDNAQITTVMKFTSTKASQWAGANAYLQFNYEYFNTTNKINIDISYNTSGDETERVIMNGSTEAYSHSWSHIDKVDSKIGIFRLGSYDNTWYVHMSDLQIARVFSYSITKNGTLVRNFIPCYRKSDSKPGLYDTVNGVFYTNAGTGEFVLP